MDRAHNRREGAKERTMTQRVEARFHCDGMDLDENGMGELQMSAMCYAGANAHFAAQAEANRSKKEGRGDVKRGRH